MIDPIYSMKKEMFRRRYSIKTIKSYCSVIDKFLKVYGLEKITKKNVNEFINKVMDKDYAGNTINIYVCAMKFLVEEILNKRWIFKFNYSKTPKKASDFLTKDEIIKLFNSIKNKKHRLMIALMYSAGLRVSELVNLRIKDLDFEHCFGWIRNGKGNKDRLFIIAERLRYDLINFVKDNKIEYNDFLFKGNSYGHLSVCTIRMILKKAKRLARINKNIHPHALRHSFATHLMENRNDILAAQSLLGHSRVDTTMGYVHNDYPIIVNVKSPYDLL